MEIRYCPKCGRPLTLSGPDELGRFRGFCPCNPEGPVLEFDGEAPADHAGIVSLDLRDGVSEKEASQAAKALAQRKQERGKSK